MQRDRFAEPKFAEIDHKARWVGLEILTDSCERLG